MSQPITAEKATGQFLANHLVPEFLNEEAPPKVNFLNSFAQYIEQHYEYNELDANKFANSWEPILVKKIEGILNEWRQLDLPLPFLVSEEDERILVSWKHPKFVEMFGVDPVGKEFCSVYQIIKNAEPLEVLVVSAIFLKKLGCAPIYFADGRDDGGVDCVGVIKQGDLKSLAILVQAKKCNVKITSNILSKEYAKYSMLAHTKKYHAYRDCVQADTKIDGFSWLYMLTSNNDFDITAQTMASCLGILLRSGKNLAHIISQFMSATELKEHISRLSPMVRPDLSFDVSLHINVKSA